MRLEEPLPERGGRAAELTCKSQPMGLPISTGAVAGCLPRYCLGSRLPVLSLCRPNGNASPGATEARRRRTGPTPSRTAARRLQGQLTGAQPLDLEVGNGST